MSGHDEATRRGEIDEDAALREERGVIAWFARNTVAANLVMFLIVVSGLVVLPGIKKEVFPGLDPNLITVSVAYPGATPEETEEGVVRRIEEAVRGLPGIEKVTGSAAEGAGAVTIEALADTDMTKLLADVKNRVDAVRTFPEEAERPIVSQVELRRQVLNVAVSGQANERALKELGQRIRDDIASLPGITQVELTNVRPYEISIEIAEDALRRWGLTFDQVAAAVRAASLDLPGGTIKSDGGEILLRTKGQAYVGPEFERIVVLTKPDGTRVTLDQVATVVDGFAELDQSSRFDGEPAVLVQVYRVGDQSALDVADTVKDYVAQVEPTLPAGISLTVWRDDTKILRSRIGLLMRNAIGGLILVFVVLALFLRFKLAFWVSLGIPISFLGALALMPGFGVSVNMISLFAFIVVLGIVVDDAIVVGENVFKHLSQGRKGLFAAIIGSREVAVPVTFAVLTTVAAFAPMLDVAGNAREIWRQIPLVVIPCLAFSLIESKLILPAHLSHQKPAGSPQRPARGLRRIGHGIAAGWSLIQKPFAAGLEFAIHRLFKPSMLFCLRWRYATVAGGLAILVFSAGLAATGWVRFAFFPAVEGDNVVAMLEMPTGTPIEVTRRAVRKIEREALELARELDAEHGGSGSVFEHVLTSIGQQPYKGEQSQNMGNAGETFSGSHLGEVNVQLVPAEDRSIDTRTVLGQWRERVGRIPGAIKLEFSAQMISPAKDIDIQLSADDIDTLRRASAKLQDRLRTYTGVEDVSDDFREGKREIKLTLRPAAEPLGLTMTDLARQVRGAFYGSEAQRIQRGRHEVKVMVRYPEQARTTLAALEDLRVRTPAGAEVPLRVVADLQFGRGYATIKRTEMARTIHVEAEVDEEKGNANEVLAAVRRDYLPQLRAEHPGLRIAFEGDAREQAETLASLARGFLIALFVIYALMAIPFKSYLQPLIVMSAIPFGLVGAIWGHVLLGFQLSIMSMLGLVALSGVVVNDSLVLVDFVNRYRASGHTVLEAAHNAGVARFRPILLTTLTTIAGLTPLLLERSVQARFLVPMAVSLAFGVAFATFISLVLVPSLYLILEDVKRAFAWLLGRPWNPVGDTVSGDAGAERAEPAAG